MLGMAETSRTEAKRSHAAATRARQEAENAGWRIAVQSLFRKQAILRGRRASLDQELAGVASLLDEVAEHCSADQRAYLNSLRRQHDEAAAGVRSSSRSPSTIAKQALLRKQASLEFRFSGVVTADLVHAAAADLESDADDEQPLERQSLGVLLRKAPAIPYRRQLLLAHSTAEGRGSALQDNLYLALLLTQMSSTAAAAAPLPPSPPLALTVTSQIIPARSKENFRLCDYLADGALQAYIVAAAKEERRRLSDDLVGSSTQIRADNFAKGDWFVGEVVGLGQLVAAACAEADHDHEGPAAAADHEHHPGAHGLRVALRRLTPMQRLLRLQGYLTKLGVAVTPLPPLPAMSESAAAAVFCESMARAQLDAVGRHSWVVLAGTGVDSAGLLRFRRAQLAVAAHAPAASGGAPSPCVFQSLAQAVDSFMRGLPPGKTGDLLLSHHQRTVCTAGTQLAFARLLEKVPWVHFARATFN